jgi:hypothetical protein
MKTARPSRKRRTDEATKLIGQIIAVCRQIERSHDGIAWLKEVLAAARFAKLSSK